MKGKNQPDIPLGLADTDDTANLLQIGDTWYLRAIVNGVKIKQSLRTKYLSEARILRDQRLSVLRASHDEKTMLQSVQRQLDGISAEEERIRKQESLGEPLKRIWQRYETSPSKNITDGTRRVYRVQWNHFVVWLKDHYPLALRSHQITRPMAQEFADYVWNVLKLAPSTYNKAIETCREVFNFAMDFDDDLNNPFARIKKAPKQTIRREIFTDDELRLIFSDEDEEFVRFCAIGLYTTQRLEVARKIRWEQFSNDLSYLEVVHKKTGADGTMVVPSALREILERVPKEERHGFVCPSYADHDGPYICLKFRRKMIKLGIVANTEREGRGLLKTCVHGYHSFRHTAVTLALRNGATSAQVKRLAGHATTAMQEHYTHFGAEDAGQASEKIGRFF